MSYFSEKASERRDRLRAEGRCIWCTEVLVYSDSPIVLAEAAIPNHTAKARLTRGTHKKSERCDLCRKKQKEQRANRDDRGENPSEPASLYAEKPVDG